MSQSREPVYAARFRDAMGRLAAGVSVVTSIDAEGDPYGLTATAVCSVSLDPPMVLVCIATSSSTHDVVEASERFAVNFLGREQADLARRFSTSDAHKFEGVAWHGGSTGCPVLPGALAACECELDRSVAAGDHTVFLGRVVTVRLEEGPPGEPLVYYRGQYAVGREGDRS